VRGAPLTPDHQFSGYDTARFLIRFAIGIFDITLFGLALSLGSAQSEQDSPPAQAIAR